MKISTILLDDEPAANKMLTLLLNKYCPQIEIKNTFTDPLKALKEIRKNPPALLFLDIEMPGMNGFDFLTRIKNFQGRVVFVTAHSNYAIRAFKFSALDYLLKPVDIQDLQQCIAKLLKTPQANLQAGQLSAAKKNIVHFSEPHAKTIAVSTHSDGVETILLSSLQYLKGEGSYTVLVRTGHKNLLLSRVLKTFDEVLASPPFVRIHKSFIVNLQNVEKVNGTLGILTMKNGQELKIGRTHRKEFYTLWKLLEKEKIK